MSDHTRTQDLKGPVQGGHPLSVLPDNHAVNYSARPKLFTDDEPTPLKPRAPNTLDLDV